MASAELECLRVEAQSEVFKELIEKAKQKFICKKKTYQQAQSGQIPSVCFMDDQERARHMKRFSKRRDAFYAQYVFGENKLSWNGLLRSLGNVGSPWVYKERSASQQGLDEEMGGKPLREYCCLEALHKYVESTVAPLRRIMLVDNVQDMPRDFQLAAMFVQARVQQRVLVPLLQYAQSGPVVLAFTRAFALQEKSVVAVAVAATRRYLGDLPLPPVAAMSVRRFWRSFDQCSTQGTRAQHSLIYLDAADPEIQGLSQVRAGAARTFAEFIRHAAVIRGG